MQQIIIRGINNLELWCYYGFENGKVIRCTKWTYNNTLKYLDIDYNYKKPYEPKYLGSPATKKYVDDTTQQMNETITAKILKSGTYNGEQEKIILTCNDGSTIEIDVSGMIDHEYNTNLALTEDILGNDVSL